MRRPSSSLRPISTLVFVFLLSVAPWAQSASVRGHRKLLTWGVGGFGWGNGVGGVGVGGGGGAQWCGPVMQMVNYRCVPGGGLVQPANYGGGGGGAPPFRNGNGNGSGGDTACSTSTARAANGATTTTTSCAGADSATSTSSGRSGRR